MINNGSSASRNDSMNNPEQLISNLNTYIYDYFLKRGYHDCARALLQDESIKLNTENNPKTSPGSRRDDMNGMDPDAMMTDGKDGEKIKIPDDLPRPSIPNGESPSSFLLDWFNLFWDFFWAQRNKKNGGDIRQYLQHNQVGDQSCPGHGPLTDPGILAIHAPARAAAQPVHAPATNDAWSDGRTETKWHGAS